MRTVTFIDSGTLIAGVRGDREAVDTVLGILDDPQRELASSVFVSLEILPKATYYRQTSEVAFYQRFFDRVSRWAEPLDEIVRLAAIEAARSGLNALDALHVAAAQVVGADELITTERPGKPLHRVTSVRVVSLREL